MQHLEHAAHALGWNGHLIPDVEILGARFAAVAAVRPDVHAWRLEHEWAPEPDPAWFRTWSDTSTHAHLPVAAVDLLGILVPVPNLSRALTACGTLMTLAPCSVVVPADTTRQTMSLIELDYYGIGVVAGDPGAPADLVLTPEDRTAEFGSSLFGRWLLEVLYSKVLASQPELAEKNSC